MLGGGPIHGHAADRINRLSTFMRKAAVSMAMVRVVCRRHDVTPVRTRPALKDMVQDALEEYAEPSIKTDDAIGNKPKRMN